jgi:uncharacterized protein (UPF0261 family)
MASELMRKTVLGLTDEIITTSAWSHLSVEPVIRRGLVAENLYKAIREACAPLVEAVLESEDYRVKHAPMPYINSCGTCGHINSHHNEDCTWGNIVRLARELKGDSK